MMYYYFAMPIVGALIGWITNILAIRLLFRPQKPRRLLFLTFQGAIPKRRAEISVALAHAVEAELLRIDEVLDDALSPKLQNEIMSRVVEVIQARTDERLPALLPAVLRKLILTQVARVSREEIAMQMPTLSKDLATLLTGNIDVHTVVESRLNAMDIDTLEAMIVRLAHKELKTIEYLGAALGFVVGLLQMAMFLTLVGA